SLLAAETRLPRTGLAPQPHAASRRAANHRVQPWHSSNRHRRLIPSSSTTCDGFPPCETSHGHLRPSESARIVADRSRHESDVRGDKVSAAETHYQGSENYRLSQCSGRRFSLILSPKWGITLAYGDAYNYIIALRSSRTLAHHGTPGFGAD